MGRSNLSQIINVEPVSEKILKKINQINILAKILLKLTKMFLSRIVIKSF